MKRKLEISKIQLLYDACCIVFSDKDHSPSAHQIQRLRYLLDTIESIDVGIDDSKIPKTHEFSNTKITQSQQLRGLVDAKEISEITYIHIHECDEFSIGMFCFPAGARLPLHDHPNMTVLSKLLYGSVYAKAYDWIKMSSNSKCKTGLAGKVRDGLLNAPATPMVLFPTTGGNLHSFTAQTPCGILDILTPPYSDDLGRPSTYFKEIQIPNFPEYAILQETELPKDVVVVGKPYLGPEIDLHLEFV